jgi:hypothetical protein
MPASLKAAGDAAARANLWTTNSLLAFLATTQRVPATYGSAVLGFELTRVSDGKQSTH